MNTQRLLAASLLMVLSACKGSCSCGADDDDDGPNPTTTVGVGGSGGSGTPSSTAAGTGGESGTGGETGEGGSGEGGGNAGGVSIRLAHLSPDAATNYDFCLIDAESDEEIGPIAGGDGLAFQDITDYDAYHSGAYTIRLVAGGASGCGTPLAETAAPEQLNFGDVRTLAVIGLASADEEDPEALSFAIYEDDLTAPAAGQVRARFLHAAPGAPAVDIGYIDDADEFVILWENASYPNDAGYVDLDAFDTISLVARATGTDVDLLTVDDVPGTEGAIVEGFAVGVATGAGADVLINVVEPLPAP